MGRIKIEDLPENLSFSKKQMRATRGGAQYVLNRRHELQYFYGAMLNVRDFREEQSYYPGKK
jgi:hypothetical protein